MSGNPTNGRNLSGHGGRSAFAVVPGADHFCPQPRPSLALGDHLFLIDMGFPFESMTSAAFFRRTRPTMGCGMVSGQGNL